MVGDMVLDHIRKEVGGPVEHEKGTTFSTEQAVIVGRVCSKDDYLTGDIVHFCNMSQAQHDAVSSHGKKVQYLFISVMGKEIHYWLVPGVVIGRILPGLAVKASTPSSILRVTFDGKSYWLEGTSITRYHQVIRMRRPLRFQPVRPIKAVRRQRRQAVAV